MSIYESLLFRITTKGSCVANENLSLESVVSASLGWFEGEAVESDTITDHTERAKALVIEQFKNKEFLNRIITSLVNQVQELEYVFWEIVNSNNLDITTGDSLDLIGERVGESRNYRSDTDYREGIRFKIFLNKSNGEPETLIQAVRILCKTDVVHFLQPYPATLMLLFKSSYDPPDTLKEQIESIALAGVKVIIGFVKTENKIFGFDGEDGEPTPPHIAGFDDSDESLDGGSFMDELI